MTHARTHEYVGVCKLINNAISPDEPKKQRKLNFQAAPHLRPLAYSTLLYPVFANLSCHSVSLAAGEQMRAVQQGAKTERQELVWEF